MAGANPFAFEQLICPLGLEASLFFGWDVAIGNFKDLFGRNGNDLAVSSLGYQPPAYGVNAQHGIVHVFHDRQTFTMFDVPTATTLLDYSTVPPGPSGVDFHFGFELAVGKTCQEGIDRVSLAVGSPRDPRVASTEHSGAVWVFPGGDSGAQLFGSHIQNHWFQADPLSPHQADSFDRFGAGIAFIDYEGTGLTCFDSGTNTAGEEKFVAAPWYDYGGHAPPGMHGEGRLFLMWSLAPVPQYQTILSINDPTPEQLPQSDFDLVLDLEGMGAASVIGAQITAPADPKEDVVVGNPAATYAGFPHAGEVRIVIWP
jgi:hypothetical protein